MENASKALLIAGATLLGMLIISLLFYAIGVIKDYRASKDELIKIEDTAKFNKKFTEYDRKDVQGYELLSLINQVIDYNERKSTDTIKGNDEQYPFISLNIKINEANMFYRDENLNETYRLFKNGTYRENEMTARNENMSNSFRVIEKKISNAFENLQIDDITKANKVAKNIGSIFLTEDEIERKKELTIYGKSRDAVLQDMANTYNLAVNPDPKVTKEYAENNFIIGKTAQETNGYYVYACMMYEYMQFKRGIFECDKLEYDENVTGRVKTIEFSFTGKIR